MSAQKQASGRTRLLYFSAIITILIVFALTLYSCWPRRLQDLLVTPTPIALVELNPRITLDPAQGYAGTVVQVTGAGWQPDRIVLLVLADATGHSDLLAASTVDSKGRFATSFLYPVNERWLRSGPHTVLAYIADTTMQSAADFVVQSPTPAPTGTPVAVATVAQPSATARSTPTPAPVISTATPAPAIATPQPTVVVIQNWRADYWNTRDLTGSPALIRDDPDVNFDWGFGSPDTAVARDNFSARWSRTMNFAEGLYRFTLEVDDGARLFVDDRLVLDEWHDGAQRTATVDQALGAGLHRLQLEYYERDGLALAKLHWERRAEFLGWRGSYFANTNLQGAPVLVRDDPAIDFAWGAGAPAPGLPVDHFSVRWVRKVNFATGRYRFSATVDDGVRVWLDDNLLIDEWHETAERTYTTESALTNRTYDLRVEYYESTLGARIRFGWEGLGAATASPTLTPLPPTSTWTPLATTLATNAPTATWTPLVTTPSQAPSMTPTWTPIPTPTPTGTVTPTMAATETATTTPTETSTATSTASATQAPTTTATLTSTVAITLTPTATTTSTPTLTPTAMPTLTAFPTVTTTLTATLTVTPTLTVTTTALLSAPAVPDALIHMQSAFHPLWVTVFWPIRLIYRKDEVLTIIGVRT